MANYIESGEGSPNLEPGGGSEGVLSSNNCYHRTPTGRIILILIVTMTITLSLITTATVINLTGYDDHYDVKYNGYFVKYSCKSIEFERVCIYIFNLSSFSNNFPLNRTCQISSGEINKYNQDIRIKEIKLAPSGVESCIIFDCDLYCNHHLSNLIFILTVAVLLGAIFLISTARCDA